MWFQLGRMASVGIVPDAGSEKERARGLQRRGLGAESRPLRLAREGHVAVQLSCAPTRRARRRPPVDASTAASSPLASVLRDPSSDLPSLRAEGKSLFFLIVQTPALGCSPFGPGWPGLGHRSLGLSAGGSQGK